MYHNVLFTVKILIHNSIEFRRFNVLIHNTYELETYADDLALRFDCILDITWQCLVSGIN